ncbi:hypothetical protein J132_05482 [Termitomyces sp. J132]|nr:hypothetical protein J132_05482 [Termitomyces sp. J132]
MLHWWYSPECRTTYPCLHQANLCRSSAGLPNSLTLLLPALNTLRTATTLAQSIHTVQRRRASVLVIRLCRCRRILTLAFVIFCQFPWPKETTGLERVALSAKGDLQRVLSAFFARPITIVTVYSNTFYHPTIHEPSAILTLPNPAVIVSASRESPITQTRQVHLQCSNKTVCTATSTVRITSPTVANLFLVEKYAIGQTFARMGKVPEFELVSVGLGPVTDAVLPSHSEKVHSTDEQLWRKYRLYIDDFECDILEVFPTREMFVDGLHWLGDGSEPLD